MEQQEKMQYRKRSVTFRLTELEASELEQKAAASGLCASAYIRKRLDGAPIIKIYQPRELLQQMAAIGNNINQIARTANTYKTIHSEAVQALQSEVQNLQKGLYQFVGEADVKCP